MRSRFLILIVLASASLALAPTAAFAEERPP